MVIWRQEMFYPWVIVNRGCKLCWEVSGSGSVQLISWMYSLQERLLWLCLLVSAAPGFSYCCRWKCISSWLGKLIGYFSCELALEHGSKVWGVRIYLLINPINGSFIHRYTLFLTLSLVLSNLGTFIQEQLPLGASPEETATGVAGMQPRVVYCPEHASSFGGTIRHCGAHAGADDATGLWGRLYRRTCTSFSALQG